jgi:hypothetical protein
MLHISTGATVTIQNEPSTGSRLVDVQGENRVVMMFTLDLRERGKLAPDKTPRN